VIPGKADPDEILGLIERHQVTLGFGSPDLVESLTRSPKWRSADFSHLRLFMTGGAPTRERLLRASHERGFNVLEGYGLSEAGPFVSVLNEDNAIRKAGSVGRPAPFVDVRIVRVTGVSAVEGEVGELLVRGPNVMVGYWRRPDATRRALDDDGWLRTGDTAYLDADGFLFIVGRFADAYMSGGTLVHPGFAERVLLRHPSVAEAVIVSGEQGAVAYVVLEPLADAGVEAELWSLSRQLLPAHARPVAIQRVASLPKNPAGKIMRHVIRSEQANTASRIDRREPV
jgi:fatty-acyl-CoA synthase